MRLNDKKLASRFEALAMPHLDAAYNLARWLTRNDQDAEDLVQNAYLRAFKFFADFNGENPRAWIMTILRNTYFSTLRAQQHRQADQSFDEDVHGHAEEDGQQDNNPETLVITRDMQRHLRLALDSLPQVFREAIVLKEIDDLSYKEIAELSEVPIGTVMSRLARGRKMLAQNLRQLAEK
jgi:RNA polymerase sigma-70 factor (ECF subfamily)